MTILKLYNSLAREKQEFVPLDENHVRVYACGPTVYNYAHIGNARMAVVFDVLARVLRRLYPRVTYASNITDIEDKIIQAAKDTGEEISTITRKYTAIYNEDMAALNVAPPDVQPLATEHVGEMIALMEALIEKGHAYAKDGHVLFNVPSYEAYGALSGRSRDEQIAGARVEVAPYKKDPADFVLWKPSSDDQPGWDSPWGNGRPGWHIECSAMAEKHLGLPFDIHGGGADLKFPHHENEIAQSCCAHDLAPDDFAKYWVHNGFVTVEGEKMSKSLGNVTLAHDLLSDGTPGEAIRFALLQSHYRQPLDWTKDGLEDALQALDKFYRILGEKDDGGEAQDTSVLAALCDDLNVPKALAAFNQLLKDGNAADLKAAGDLLGILQYTPGEWVALRDAQKQGAAKLDPATIENLLEERRTARANKNFARADAIRDQLAEAGITIKDAGDTTEWEYG